MGVGIEVKDLNAWYGTNHTLQDINLNIPASAIFNSLLFDTYLLEIDSLLVQNGQGGFTTYNGPAGQPLNLPLNEPDPPLFGRDPIRREMFATDRNTLDDRFDAFASRAAEKHFG